MSNEASSMPNTNLKLLGNFLDGYAVVIENKGGLAENVRQNMFDDLRSRNLPNIVVTQQQAHVGNPTQTRPYTITARTSGASTTIFVGDYGKDLYASWRTYIRHVTNSRLILAIFAIALFLHICIGVTSIGSSFLLEGEDNTTELGAIESTLCGSIFPTVLLIEIIAIGIAGIIRNGNPRTYFVIEPTLFDAEDITAMSMSVHYALIRALEAAGIEKELLRRKSEFKSGRSEVV